jgi:hypothetical protein
MQGDALIAPINVEIPNPACTKVKRTGSPFMRESLRPPSPAALMENA